DELLHVLMHERVDGDVVTPLRLLMRVGQLPVDQQVCRLEIRALFCQLLDGIPAVQQDALVAVDERDGAGARSGVHERRVVEHQSVIGIAGRQLLEGGGANGPVLDGNLDGLPSAIVSNGQGVRHGRQSATRGMAPPWRRACYRSGRHARGGLTRRSGSSSYGMVRRSGVVTDVTPAAAMFR